MGITGGVLVDAAVKLRFHTLRWPYHGPRMG